MRGSSPPCGATRGEQPLTLPLSLAHSFALTGAGASVSPRTGERRERRPSSRAIRLTIN